MPKANVEHRGTNREKHREARRPELMIIKYQNSMQFEEMECAWKKPWVMLMGAAVLMNEIFGSSISSGCFPEEKRSLLEFKACYSDDSLLPSWVDDDHHSNCCKWERVTCFGDFTWKLEPRYTHPK
ncbi:hypothetical protein PIB30_059984 [Stylosanthes scabra]|uniref:Leucine-rich repeat-containing N-terminal plant-type domain-containing protein n=1 Tax=Stylosanthes scabra TaxID=79078 RepID=A0ABU6QM75_9FABA|nr:hypothetical protein [Stylosanthes scabra]